MLHQKQNTMDKASEFYVDLLNRHKSTGYLFGIIPMPGGIPILFTITSVLTFAMIGIYIGNPYLSAIPCFALIWEHYTVAVKRNRIYDECVVNEAYMQIDFKENGADPNFPEDPLYVTNEDREDIFQEAVYKFKREKFIQKLKSHHVFLLIAMAQYIGVYQVIRLII